MMLLEKDINFNFKEFVCVFIMLYVLLYYLVLNFNFRKLFKIYYIFDVWVIIIFWYNDVIQLYFLDLIFFIGGC